MFFDYWFGYFASSVRAVKYMAGWTYINNQIYQSVYLPLLSDINTDKQLIDFFVDALLGHHRNMCVRKCRNLLLLIFYTIGKS